MPQLAYVTPSNSVIVAVPVPVELEKVPVPEELVEVELKQLSAELLKVLAPGSLLQLVVLFPADAPRPLLDPEILHKIPTPQKLTLLTLRKIHIPQHRCLLLCSAHLSQFGPVPLLLLREEELLGNVVTEKFLRLLVVKVVFAEGLTCCESFKFLSCRI